MKDSNPSIPSISVKYAQDGSSTKSNALGMRPMQERVWQKRGEQYLLIKSPPASGKSRALMFIALDKLANQKLKQAIIVVPEKSIGASFHDEPLSQFGFWADWKVEPKWNLCDAPGADNGGKVEAVKKFLESGDKVLVCTHATFRFAVEKFGVEAFDDRLIAVDEFHHVSANPDSRLGDHVRQFMARDKTHLVAMTGSYFRGDAEAVLHPDDESRFDTVTYTYYEQLNGYQYLKQLDIGYYFYAGSYTDEILKVLNPGGEDDPAHSQRQLAREHEGQDPRGGAHHRGTGRVAGRRSEDRFPTREDRRRKGPEDRRSGGRRSGEAGEGVRRAERPGAEEQPRSRGHHHRPGHGEGGLRLDLVRARADGRLSVEPDGDRADHRPRHARCTGQDAGPVHQPHRRAGRHRGRPSPRR